MESVPQQRPSAVSSRERIVAAGTLWYRVLDVSISASAEDVKRAYRNLALLHHPDKADGDADTFKRVKEAHEVGMKKSQKRLSMARKRETNPKAHPKAKPKAKAASKEDRLRQAQAKATEKAQEAQAKLDEKLTAAQAKVTSDQAKAAEKAQEAQTKLDEKLRAAQAKARPKPSDSIREEAAKRAKVARPKPWRLPEAPGKAKIRKAVDLWQSPERWQEKTKPEQVLALASDAFAAYLQANACIPVDVRDIGGDSNGEAGLKVKDVAQLSFSMLVSSPEEMAPNISSLRESGKLLVLISDKGTAMSTCGLVGAILLDVFGIDSARINRLDGGFVAWSKWLEANKDVAETLAPAQSASTSSTSASTASASAGKAKGASRKSARSKLWEVPAGANTAKVHKAIEHWESSERWDVKTLPDQIPLISTAQLAELVRASACVSVDVRKATDIDAEGSQLGVHEAVPISFTQMVLNPADVLGQVVSLKRNGKRLVLYSELGDRMDACGLLGALLLDVFGFDEQLVCRLQGGCTAWAQWLEANKDDARTLEPLAMRLSRLRKKRERDLAHIRAELHNRSTTSAATGSPSASVEPCAAAEIVAAPEVPDRKASGEAPGMSGRAAATTPESGGEGTEAAAPEASGESDAASADAPSEAGEVGGQVDDLASFSDSEADGQRKGMDAPEAASQDSEEAAEASQEKTKAPAVPGQTSPSSSPQEEDCEMPPSQADSSQCPQHASDSEPNDEDEATPESPVLEGNLDFHHLPPSSGSEAEDEHMEETETTNFAKQPQNFDVGCSSQSVAPPGQEYAVLGGS